MKILIATDETQADPATELWICEVCEDVYDPQLGDPDGGIPRELPSRTSPTTGSVRSVGRARRNSGSSGRARNTRM